MHREQVKIATHRRKETRKEQRRIEVEWITHEKGQYTEEIEQRKGSNIHLRTHHVGRSSTREMYYDMYRTVTCTHGMYYAAYTGALVRYYGLAFACTEDIWYLQCTLLEVTVYRTRNRHCTVQCTFTGKVTLVHTTHAMRAGSKCQVKGDLGV